MCRLGLALAALGAATAASPGGLCENNCAAAYINNGVCEDSSTGCPWGHDCDDCAVGMYRAGDDADASVCKACPRGYAQSSTGQASCTPCIPGEYQNQTGQTQCLVCAADTYAGLDVTDSRSSASFAWANSREAVRSRVFIARSGAGLFFREKEREKTFFLREIC